MLVFKTEFEIRLLFFQVPEGITGNDYKNYYTFEIQTPSLEAVKET